MAVGGGEGAERETDGEWERYERMTEQTDSNISLTSYPARGEAEIRRAHARGATTKADTGTPTNGKRTENMAADPRASERASERTAMGFGLADDRGRAAGE
jgi:hypothetical protein